MTLASTNTLAISEMREFAGFESGEQAYIKRSLDIGLARCDAFRLWGTTEANRSAIRRQYVVYQDLKPLRAMMPIGGDIERFLGKLVRIAAFDLEQDRIEGFSAFRFLYERLIGPEIRPFLPSAFCAAAALPQIRPDRRKLLLQSLSEAAATAPGWSKAHPRFYPEHVGEAEAV